VTASGKMSSSRAVQVAALELHHAQFPATSDFRARRRVLLKSDFAVAEGPVQRPSDKIDKATWDHIVTLPDDVAIRTINHHGRTIKQISDLYRLANSAMRSALELVAIGTWAKGCGKQSEFQKWQKGKIELSLGMACDGLTGATSALRNALTTRVNDSLFDQKTNTTEGRWVRRAFSSISDFPHSRPGDTDYSMRKSNGPTYVPSAFNHSIWIQTETMELLFVLVLIANPNIRFNQIVVDLFVYPSKVKSRVARAAFKILHP
jgi:hypothetical protein